nr:hypothetical protein [Halocatena marina]
MFDSNGFTIDFDSNIVTSLGDTQANREFSRIRRADLDLYIALPRN